jgi:1,2-diacylglycerol 3-alpha-glucosyltransferase
MRWCFGHDMEATASTQRRFGQPTLVAWEQFAPYHLARLRSAGQSYEVVGLELFAQSGNNVARGVGAGGEPSRVAAFLDVLEVEVPPRLLLERLAAIIRAVNPGTVAVHGWSSRSARALLTAAVRAHIPVIMMSDSTASDRPRLAWREMLKRRIVGLCSAGFVAGSPQRDYLVTLGLDRNLIFDGYDVVDNDHFARGAAAARANGSAARRRFGLPEQYFLAVGRLVGVGEDAGVKNHFRLIDAYARYRQTASSMPWKLVIVGDGDLRTAIERQIGALSLAEYVVLTGAWLLTRPWRRAYRC